MNRTLVKDTVNNTGKEIRLNGWVQSTRRMGKMIFIDLRDVTGIVQVVFLSDNEALVKQAKQLRPEFVVEIIGKVNKRPDNLINKEMITLLVFRQGTSMQNF